MPKFPDCFPDNFESDILPKRIEFSAHCVYRILKQGILCSEAFISSFEEFPKRFRNKIDASAFSTSCFEDYDEISNLMEFTFRDKNPAATLAFGTTEPVCGPCQPSDNASTSHLHWWIYKDSHPERFFKEVTT